MAYFGDRSVLLAPALTCNYGWRVTGSGGSMRHSISFEMIKSTDMMPINE